MKVMSKAHIIFGITDKTITFLIFLVIGVTLLTIGTVANAQSQNDTAQYIQLKKFALMLGTDVDNYPFAHSNDVNFYKQFLSTAVAVNEGYTNDPNPANYALSNQTKANIDIKITNYLCSIDQTYCANGPNAPVRIIRNSVPSNAEQEDNSPAPFQIGP